MQRYTFSSNIVCKRRDFFAGRLTFTGLDNRDFAVWGQIPLVVFGSKEGETARVLYYNAKSNTVYDTGITILTKKNEEPFNID